MVWSVGWSGFFALLGSSPVKGLTVETAGRKPNETPALPAIEADRLPSVFSCLGSAKVETFPFLSSLIFYHIFCRLAQNRGVGFQFADCHSERQVPQTYIRQTVVLC